MGNQQIKEKLVEYIRADKEKKVKDLLLKKRCYLNEIVVTKNNFTPLMCCAYYNSVKSLNVLLELLVNYKLKEPNRGDSILHIACERNNIKIIKEILGKNLVNINELNAYEMTCLDIAVVNRSYNTVVLLVNEYYMKLKSIDDYKNYLLLLNLLNFKIELFLEHVNKNTPFENTPSFLYKIDKNGNNKKEDVEKDKISKEDLSFPPKIGQNSNKSRKTKYDKSYEISHTTDVVFIDVLDKNKCYKDNSNKLVSPRNNNIVEEKLDTSTTSNNSLTINLERFKSNNSSFDNNNKIDSFNKVNRRTSDLSGELFSNEN